MEAITKTGRIIIEGDKVVLTRDGIMGALATVKEWILLPVYLLLGVNRDKVIEVREIRKVEYHKGIKHVIKPHMKIDYGNKKPRFVIFKRLRDIGKYEGAVAEMTKALREFERLGVKTVAMDKAGE